MNRLLIAALLMTALTGAALPTVKERAEQACFSDLQRFCPGRDGFTTNACLQANYPALSDRCRAMLGPFGLLPGGDPFGEDQRPYRVLPNGGGFLPPSNRAGDRGVGGGIGGGEPHNAPGPFGR